MDEYLNDNDQVSSIFNLINDIISKVRGENGDSFGSLSINSKLAEEEAKYPLEDDHIVKIDSKQSEEDYRTRLEEARLTSEALRAQNDELARLLGEK